MIEVVFRLQRRDGGAKTNSRSLCAKYCSPVITRLSRDTLIILISDHLIKIESDLFSLNYVRASFHPAICQALCQWKTFKASRITQRHVSGGGAG